MTQAGTIAIRDRVRFGDGNGKVSDGKVTAIRVFADGTAERRDSVSAGQIARLSGLAEIQVGDVIGTAPGNAGGYHFAPPTLETAVVARDQRAKARLHAAVTQLAEQDPLINVRQDDIRQEIYVSLYGEVQKQVIEATLDTDYSDRGPRAPSADPAAHQGRGGHGVVLRPLRAGSRPRADEAADGRQPAQPRGVPAPGAAAGLVTVITPPSASIRPGKSRQAGPHPAETYRRRRKASR